ncbi:MAG: UvrD-helicase domain-containing protein [Candidatus Kapabacteria bacterium]|nr:UvrD-helicase domain-containing protein [Candidatus Kapabacteria bacterium]MDW7996748.1 UvrD-helicase domain-containing protein [Bacteroidota bacterium]
MRAAVKELLQHLNPAQRQAVTHGDGPLLVIAGAGSGKTRVLTYRIAYLLWRGVSPETILALTFTNKAADEMRHRVTELVSTSHAQRLWIGTFHSMFARILRTEAPLLGYTAAYTIYDTEDSTGLLRLLLRQMGIAPHVLDPSTARHAISHLKNRMVSWQEAAATATNPRERLLAQLYQEYDRQLRANNAMDFDDLLLNIIRLFQNHPDVLTRYQNRFRYVFVDEYQDTNRTQYMALRLLTARYRNLCVVGDDAQSIYRWRGADIRNILDFERDYPDATLVRLEQNYRSTKRILLLADSLIRCNRHQIPKRLWTNNPEGDPATLLICADERDEAAQVVQRLAYEHECGYRYGDIAVLYRTNAQSQALEEACRRAGIPYVLIGAISFYQRKEIKDALAYVRLLINPADTVSWLRILNLPPRGIGAATIEHLRTASQEWGCGLWEAMERCQEIPHLRRSACETLSQLVALVHRFQDALRRQPLDIAVLEYLEATGLLAYYRNEDKEEERYRNLERFIATLSEYVEQSPSPSLQEYLQHISLLSEIDQTPDATDAVLLMTLHAAKGLEFPVVFITGLEQGLVPIARSISTAEELEEERRLLYVGITRAQHKLYLAYAQYRRRWGEMLPSQPSPFLSELPSEQLVVEHSPNVLPTSVSVFSASVRKAEAAPTLGLRLGARVHHPVFGVGVVEALSGNGQDSRALVRFISAGRKLLLLRYARLQVLE